MLYPSLSLYSVASHFYTKRLSLSLAQATAYRCKNNPSLTSNNLNTIKTTWHVYTWWKISKTTYQQQISTTVPRGYIHKNNTHLHKTTWRHTFTLHIRATTALVCVGRFINMSFVHTHTTSITMLCLSPFTSVLKGTKQVSFILHFCQMQLLFF